VLDIVVTEDAVVEVGATVAVIGEDSVEDLAPEPEPESVAPAAAQTISPDRVEKLPRIRRTIARRMLDSLPTAAQLTTVVEVDVTSVARLRVREKAEFQRSHDAKLSFLLFFVAAAVEALANHPVINASLDADCSEVTYRGAVHLGMAVDSDMGLMVPVIRNAAAASIPQIAQAIADSAERVRSKTIRPDDLFGGTSRSPTPAVVGRCSIPRSSTSPSRRFWVPGRSSTVLSPRASTTHSRSISGRWPTSRCPTTTASSTAPTPPAT
jgi:2-oxoglutarate dehydrogenase E2 component (dihydrolipoamide succinyltransferase)